MFRSAVNFSKHSEMVTQSLVATGAFQTYIALSTARYFSTPAKDSTKKSKQKPRQAEESNVYQATLNLPSTEFPMRPIGGSAASESNLRNQCTDQPYTWQAEESNDSVRALMKGSQPLGPDGKLPTFILHDGPPFANGPLHTGHFLNKTLKDIINRYKLMRGHRVMYHPGWDCHGLPIEHKALAHVTNKETGTKKNSDTYNPNAISTFEVRELAEKLATSAMNSQMEGFKSWGIMGHWDDPYVTMAPTYEAMQLEVFAKLVERGLIFRAQMPVYWSPSSGTALAEAELEYEDHVSLSALIGFAINESPSTVETLSTATDMPREVIANLLKDKQLSLMIWTTTPWTLPSNRAVAFSPDAEYVVVQVTRSEAQCQVSLPSDQDIDDGAKEPSVSRGKFTESVSSYYIVAKDLVGSLEEMFSRITSSREATLASHVKTAEQTLRRQKQSKNKEKKVDQVQPQPQPQNVELVQYSIKSVSSVFPGKALSDVTYSHPLSSNPSIPALEDCGQLRTFPGEHVTTESGSGLVHTAPGHGVDDFVASRPFDIPVACPVDSQGLYTADLGSALEGADVLDDANERVLALLKNLPNGGSIVLATENHSHRYPHDWRTKKPVIFRTTSQWFCNLESIRSDSLRAIDEVEFNPSSGRTRLATFVSGRNQWCISRQRSWGLPIPAFYHKQTGEALLSPDVIQHVSEVFKTHGSQAWWSFPTWKLLPEQYRGSPNPLQADSADSSANDELAYDCQYSRGTDTMDVWLDSGSSWKAALETRQVPLKAPADMYLEGSDQHRGWFQSSLLTSVAIQGKAPYKKVLCHGFVVDEEGKKMSKSLGNGLEPHLLIHGIPQQSPETKKSQLSKAEQFYAKFPTGTGVDVLRVWVGSVDYTRDATISPVLITIAQETVRKWRSTIRYIMGCLETTTEKSDGVKSSIPFSPLSSADMVPYDQLTSVDKYFLHELHSYISDVTDAYDSNNFVRVLTLSRHFVSSTFSAFYADLSKDRLYSEPTKSLSRRSCLTVLTYTLEALSKTLAPIAPHIVEEVFTHLHPDFQKFFVSTSAAIQSPLASFEPKSLFMTGWLETRPEWNNPEVFSMWNNVKTLRGTVYKSLERYKEFTRLLESDTASAETVVPELVDFVSSGKSLPRIGSTLETNAVIEILYEEPMTSTCSIDSATSFFHSLKPLTSSQTQTQATLADSFQVSGLSLLLSPIPREAGRPALTTDGVTTLGTAPDGTNYVQWSGIVEVETTPTLKINLPVRITVARSTGCKCARCWKYAVPAELETLPMVQNVINMSQRASSQVVCATSLIKTPTLGSSELEEGLCGRCADAVCESFQQ